MITSKDSNFNLVKNQDKNDKIRIKLDANKSRNPQASIMTSPPKIVIKSNNSNSRSGSSVEMKLDSTRNKIQQLIQSFMLKSKDVNNFKVSRSKKFSVGFMIECLISHHMLI